MTTTLKEVLTHPYTAAISAVGVLGGVLKLPILVELWAWLLANAGSLFTTFSIMSFTLAPKVPVIPERPLVVLALLTGAVLVYKKGRQAITKLRRRLNS